MALLFWLRMERIIVIAMVQCELKFVPTVVDKPKHSGGLIPGEFKLQFEIDKNWDAINAGLGGH